jgi:hypothetical protein
VQVVTYDGTFGSVSCKHEDYIYIYIYIMQSGSVMEYPIVGIVSVVDYWIV